MVHAHAKTLPPTKRSLLKIAAKISDPLGHLSLFTLNLKILIQQLCIDKIPWDTELQGAYKERYGKLDGELSKLQGLMLPRYVREKDRRVQCYQMHAYSDTSEQAYATTVYLRTEYDNGDVTVRLVS